MFRDNEASRVGEVLAQRALGDRAATIAAALELWVTPAERPDEPDGAASETWRAIVELDAVDDAVAAGLAAIRGRQLIRAHAFIDLVERIEDPAILFELADLVLDCRWPVHPYLATICFALVDGKHEDALWTWIGANRARLNAGTPEWILVGVILTTTRIGTRFDVDVWFAGFDGRRDVPMWIVSAYVASLLLAGGVTSARIAMIAMDAIAAHCTVDATAGLLVLHLLLTLIAAKNDDEFFTQYRATRASIGPAPMDDGHPLIGYINGAKHARPIGRADFEYVVAVDSDLLTNPKKLVVRTRTQRPANWRCAALICAAQPVLVSAARLLPFLDELERVTPGDRRAVELHYELQNARPAELKAILPLWHRLQKQKIGWLTRLRLAYF